MSFSDRDLYEYGYEDDREYDAHCCNCGSDDVACGIGGEPYCGECYEEEQREKRRRKERAAGKRAVPSYVAGVLCVWYDEHDQPDYAEVDMSYICPALVEELEDEVCAKVVDMPSAGRDRMRAVFAKEESCDNST